VMMAIKWPPFGSYVVTLYVECRTFCSCSQEQENLEGPESPKQCYAPKFHILIKGICRLRKPLSLLLVFVVRRLESNSRNKFSIVRAGMYATMESCSMQLRQSSITDERTSLRHANNSPRLHKKANRGGSSLKWMGIIETTYAATMELSPWFSGSTNRSSPAR
jgi:hypothetical protein